MINNNGPLLPINTGITYAGQVATTSSNSFIPTYTNIYYTPSYTTFKLPRKKLPESIFVNGRMLTMGILCSDAECAYTGDNLIFSPNTFSLGPGGKITLLLQYSKETYHYSVKHNFGVVIINQKSTLVEAKLLSITKRG